MPRDALAVEGWAAGIIGGARRLLLSGLSCGMQDMGYAGWRMDFVKGYAPEYVKEYIEDTIGADRFHVLVPNPSPCWHEPHADCDPCRLAFSGVLGGHGLGRFLPCM